MAETESDSVFIPLTKSTEGDRQALLDEYFSGNLLEWAARRSRFLGDYILPKVIYIEYSDGQSHTVAWVEHHGMNPKTHESIHNHHVVCECVLCENFDDGKGGINTRLCDVMERSLERRAQQVGETYQANINLGQSYEVTNVMTGSKEKSRDFDLENMAMKAIEQVLRADKAHPEAWHANAISGVLSVEQASRIVGLPVEITSMSAMLLSKSGVADFNGEELRLAA